jgi:hypothetical protein
MTNKTDRRKFLKTALAIMVGVAGVGVLSSGTALSKTTAGKQTSQRTGLVRQQQVRTAERTLPKPDSDSQPIFSPDDFFTQDRKAKLYNHVSPIPIEGNQTIKRNALVNLPRTPDLPSFLGNSNNRCKLVELQIPDLPRFLWDSNEPDELVNQLKKLGLKPPKPRESFFFFSGPFYR